MQTYLLLRKNVQSGPFELKELIALDLQPTDLIWVEGQSCSWRYPGEINELAAYAVAEVMPSESMATISQLQELPVSLHQEPEPEINSRHKVVAIRPDKNISIQTVKAQPRLVKVQVRATGEEKDLVIKESLIGKVTPVKEEVLLPAGKGNAPATDNRIDFFVLAIGAVSILAVLYLLFTSTY